MANGLMLHAGAHTATLDQIREVVTPDGTDTHVPVAHDVLISAVTDSLEARGLHIVEQEYGLWGKSGERMFGVMTLKNGTNHSDYSLAVALRNSHDKSLPATIGIGSHVFVCDNLALLAEIKALAKHTKNVVNRLPGLVDKTVERLIRNRGWIDARIFAYKNTVIGTEGEVHDLVIRMFDEGVIPNERIKNVLHEWREPRYVDFSGRTVWSLFNATTEALKGAPTMLSARTQKLHALMDKVVGFASIVDATAIDDTPDVEVVTT